MSNDLISRKDLISHIENQYRLYGEEYDAVQILSDIEDFEVAYNVDKVVRKLELCQLSDKAEYKHLNMPIVKAIEIVKGGGVE